MGVSLFKAEKALAPVGNGHFIFEPPPPLGKRGYVKPACDIVRKTGAQWKPVIRRIGGKLDKVFGAPRLLDGGQIIINRSLVFLILN